MALPLTYHWRNLFVRKTTTTLTILVIAAVVGVFAWVLGFDGALKSSLSTARDPRKILVLKRGATSESNSAIPVEEFSKLNQLPEIARDPKTNQPLLSPESMGQLSCPRLRDFGATWGNIALRGVTPTAFKVHTTVRLVEGRLFQEGAQEVIVGRSAAQQFLGLNLGDVVQLGYSGNRDFKVVGIFTAEGGPMESEVWGYLPSILNAYNRTMYSSAALRVRDGVDPRSVIERIEGPAIQLTAATEGDYWNDQVSTIKRYLTVTRILVFVMALAAVFAIANTMFSMVAGRTREVAMLRTIGFTPFSILSGFVLEAVLLSLLGGLVGCAGCLAWLKLVGSSKDMFGSSSFTTLAFNITLSGATVAIALVTVVLVGVIGSVVPAFRAAHVAVIAALREP